MPSLTDTYRALIDSEGHLRQMAEEHTAAAQAELEGDDQSASDQNSYMAAAYADAADFIKQKISEIGG